MAEVKSYKFEVPSKKVKCPEMVKAWEESESYQEYLGWGLQPIYTKPSDHCKENPTASCDVDPR